MNEKVREPNKPNTEDQESNDSSRSPGVTDRGLISHNKDNTKEASKDSKIDVTSQQDKPGDSVKSVETLDED
ncbi:MAG: hypothetical protein KME60_15615 [Cyanomargarita calcarea GSE-NOS-MK-12-04C]|jgi:hypothetical protein|uniref:Uncharacterized protein n=1 Tax=Cyanomargarita calcarea GSE-NOS-MK-12-04C TaxID=2839659 RepID=A0A951UVD8_9CYAN|nr:hypothetical protein [Cyanomargarita calcarea GSE-NOS-MK-12-04C]